MTAPSLQDALDAARLEIDAARARIAELEAHNDAMDARNVVLRKRIAELEAALRKHHRWLDRVDSNTGDDYLNSSGWKDIEDIDRSSRILLEPPHG